MGGASTAGADAPASAVLASAASEGRAVLLEHEVYALLAPAGIDVPRHRLVPFPGATDDHQRKNADVLVDAGAAVMIEERTLTGERLAGEAATLLADAASRRQMGEAMRGFAQPRAAARIVDRVLALAGREEGASV